MSFLVSAPSCLVSALTLISPSPWPSSIFFLLSGSFVLCLRSPITKGGYDALTAAISKFAKDQAVIVYGRTVGLLFVLCFRMARFFSSPSNSVLVFCDFARFQPNWPPSSSCIQSIPIPFRFFFLRDLKSFSSCSLPSHWARNAPCVRSPSSTHSQRGVVLPPQRTHGELVFQVAAVTEITAHLQQQNLRADAYHAQLSPAARTQVSSACALCLCVCVCVCVCLFLFSRALTDRLNHTHITRAHARAHPTTPHPHCNTHTHARTTGAAAVFAGRDPDHGGHGRLRHGRQQRQRAACGSLGRSRLR
jgi:hypothetical protein